MTNPVGVCQTNVYQILSSYNHLKAYFKAKGDEKIQEIKKCIFTSSSYASCVDEFVKKEDLRRRQVNVFTYEGTEKNISNVFEARRILENRMRFLNFPKTLQFQILNLQVPHELRCVLDEILTFPFSENAVIRLYKTITILPLDTLIKILKLEVSLINKLNAIFLPLDLLNKFLELNPSNEIAKSLFSLVAHVDGNYYTDRSYFFVRSALNVPKDLLLELLSLNNASLVKKLLSIEDNETFINELKIIVINKKNSNEELFKLRICICKNGPAFGKKADLQYQSPIDISSITDTKVKNRTPLYSNCKEIDTQRIVFNSGKGICRGETFWFIYLYLSIQHLFSDPLTPILAAGKQFAQGGENESILLQGLYHIKKGKMLNLKIDACFQDPASKSLNAAQVYQNDEAIRILSSLNNGVYKVDLEKHACAYIKISQDLAYYFDPNYGVFELSGNYRYYNLIALVKWYFPENYQENLNFKICSLRRPQPIDHLPEKLQAQIAEWNIPLKMVNNFLNELSISKLSDDFIFKLMGVLLGFSKETFLNFLKSDKSLIRKLYLINLPRESFEKIVKLDLPDLLFDKLVFLKMEYSCLFNKVLHLPRDLLMELLYLKDEDMRFFLSYPDVHSMQENLRLFLSRQNEVRSSACKDISVYWM